jgi:hypothetical protein
VQTQEVAGTVAKAAEPDDASSEAEASIVGDVSLQHQVNIPQPVAAANLEAFIQGVAKLAAAFILRMPTKKATSSRQTEATTERHSSRLATKALKKGSKTADEMAQEILCKTGFRADPI